MHATFPASWYAQPYSVGNLVITSFPIHVDDARVWDSIPRGGAAIAIFDSTPVPRAFCRKYPGEHPPLRLSNFQPNYEAFGPAYRIEFHEHGHDILVFISFGGRTPTRGARANALAVLNSIHVYPSACPVHEHLSFGSHG